MIPWIPHEASSAFVALSSGLAVTNSLHSASTISDLTSSSLRDLMVREAFFLLGVVIGIYIAWVTSFLLGLELLWRGGEVLLAMKGALPLRWRVILVVVGRERGGSWLLVCSDWGWCLRWCEEV